ncbi:MAG: translational GTPase TypA [Bacilli bacterium]|jgi:GTP-binding protein|nr:translational GTPase TypA [Bacilli bacterium]MCH4210304.1 translational GTPase TypA [Bacilli bacterium]MCH4228719.1 translational GTPase TypA [Bacilli bacterium]MCH4278334.1 translational GTPase TypA [Bacilli bacterium]MCI2054794.1 translational GTPase TypA [Bacilli bacterium]
MDIRNIAIIAHVDHGKTTLVNSLLTSSGTFRANEAIQDRMLDSNPLEHERGITILAKTTSIHYKGTKINIVDTPGHADFGGEVERIMHMVDGCLLLVDAYEGTMPQTRFVLKNALENHIKPIVVINKVDRPNANPKKAVDEVLDLFIELGAPDDLLDFPVCYVSALNGTSSMSADPASQKPGMDCLFDLIIKNIPTPKADPNGPFQWQSALLDYNDFVGRIGIGTVRRGKIKVGDSMVDVKPDGENENFKVMKLYTFYGMERDEVNEVEAGDICGIAGLSDIGVSDTVCDPSKLEALPPLRVDEPTLQMEFGTNSSPLRGQDGKKVTARVIEERLFEETQRDVSLKFRRVPNAETWIVSGRGELHLGVLIETMRREGYELEVSKPQVIIKTIDGVKCEPYEDLQIDVPNEFVGDIMTTLGNRGSQLINMDDNGTNTRLVYVIPSRGLIGFVSNFLTMTKGYGIINHEYKEYRPMYSHDLGERNIGVLVSTDKGSATSYALQKVEEHGTMFIVPGDVCYEGMIVGEHRYPVDLAVNCTMSKPMTNVRSSTRELMIVLKAPRKMTLEACLDYVNLDELVEITPHSIRMRKRILDTSERKKYDAHKKAAAEAMENAD